MQFVIDEKETFNNIPSIKDPFDPAPLENLFKDFKLELVKLENQAAALVVNSDVTHRVAITMSGQVKQIGKAVEGVRVEKKQPYLDMCRHIDGFAKPITETLKKIDATLSDRMRPWMIEQDRIRREAEAKAREEAAALQRKLEQEARDRAEAERKAQLDAGVKDPEVIVEKIPEIIVPAAIQQEAKTVTDTASAKLKTEWQGKLVSVELLPPECIKARFVEIEKAVQPWINNMIKAGVREIPGVEIKEVAIIQTRVRR